MASRIHDVTMPTMDGLTALAEIIQFDAAATVVMVSAVVQTEHADLAMQAGARDVLAKPLHGDRLLAVVNSLIGAAPTPTVDRGRQSLA